ncbi:MAG: ATP-dependent sacrificial sulfur transferase LarE, partial [Deltaproteobacteria bacterium]|nr:ATP-dependent sacrificial sulfur transferase LarE [Deltaproteobacteria bacterium]
MNKLQHLKQLLNEMASAVLAFSGGVDSTFLLKIAHEILGERLLAVTAISPIYPEWEIKQAKSIASELGIRHLLVENEALANQKFIQNPPQRCYWCKIDLYGRLKRLALEHNCAVIMDGTNADDHTDYRPGMRATQELGIRSPLQEAGLTKDEIRQLSREIGLQTWDKPSCACLASRFPYGQAINE